MNKGLNDYYQSSARCYPPLTKGARGDFFNGNLRQIPLNPPFIKGDLIELASLRKISSSQEGLNESVSNYAAIMNYEG
jgi:hypothetical protein